MYFLQNSFAAMVEISEFCEPKPFTLGEEASIDELRRLCRSHSDIHFQLDNYFLTKFLRFCDWNPPRAFESILTFYALKRQYPTYYASKNISEYFDLLNLNSRIVLEKRDQFGRIIFVCKLGNVTSTTQYIDAAIIDDIWVEVLLSDPLTQINGISIICDCKGVNSSILKWLIPKNCKMGASKLESFPVKDWTIHLVNIGPILKACIMLVKPFLRKSTIAKFQFHNNGYADLHASLGQEFVPEEYGGLAGPIDYEKSMKFIMAHEKMLERNRQFGYKLN